MDVDTHTQHLSDYLAILRRRRKQVFRVAAFVLVTAVILAFVIPPKYRSSATILIEQQEVPKDIVASTVTGYANQRLQIIQQRVLTQDNLLRISEKLGVYPTPSDKEKAAAIAGRMRSSVKIEPVSANVTDPRSGASMMATIAFKLSFDGQSPEMAQKVAEELVSLFLNENLRIRTQKAEQTSGFLAEEEERLSKHIADLESKLADYKERNTGKLPELMNLNMSLMEQTQRELENLERQVVNLEERRLQLQGQLASVEPYTGTGPGGRYKELQAQYLQATATYSPDHPDVVRLRREIELLRKEAGVTEEYDAAEAELKKVRGELERARNTYSADHPDVVRLTKRQAGLEAKLRASAGSSALGAPLRPDNPAYIALKTQLDTVELSLKATREQQARAKQKLAEYEGRLVQTPRIEQEGLSLRREYDSAVRKYQEIRQGVLGAETAVALEREQKGERYSLLEPPDLPEGPNMPNRKAFILLGIVLGFGGGVGYASVAEYMDRTIRGARAITAVLRTPPLAVIPYIPNGQEPYAKGA
jgi:uncharacterized protein involved in exopolysaccharide biosynthesis